MEKLKNKIEEKISSLKAEPSELNNAKIEALEEVLGWITEPPKKQVKEKEVYPFKAKCIREDEAKWFRLGGIYVYRFCEKNEWGKVAVSLHNGEGVSIVFYTLKDFNKHFETIES